jgi:hypothetical protein
VDNSTLSSNIGAFLGGALLNLSGANATIQNSTITGNAASVRGGGINNYGTLKVQNSIVALQYMGDDCYNSGSITSYGYNIESGTTCGFTESSDIQGVVSDELKLGPLADNGGPTYTHALLADSVAIDWIPESFSLCVGGVSVDQRGAVRAGGAAETGGPYCDVGAFEYASEETPSMVTIQSISLQPADASVLAAGSGLLASLLAAAGWWLHKKR